MHSVQSRILYISLIAKPAVFCFVCAMQMTKEQLAKLCKTIVNFIAQTTLQILLPALARILGVTGFYDNADSLKRGGSARSFTAFEQKRLELIQEVKYLAK